MDCVGSPIISLFVFILLMIVEGILVAFQSSLDNVNDNDVEDDDIKEDDLRILNFHLDNPIDLSNTVKTYTIMAFTIMSVYCCPGITTLINNYAHLDSYISSNLCYIIVLLVLFILLFGVNLGLSIVGDARALKMAKRLLKIGHLLITIFTPFMIFFMAFGKIIVRLFGVDPNHNVEEVSEDEILTMVNEGHEQGVIETSEVQMINNIFEFTEKEAQDIMTHRKNMVMVDGDITYHSMVEFMKESNNSRFPVYIDDTDNIIGVIHIRDCFERIDDKTIIDKSIKDIPDLIRDIQFIPETRNIADLFNSMQQEKNHMAIVVDEYGQTSGLVTMEDILEEIVGNIFDEYDEEALSIQNESDGSFLIEGMTELTEVQDTLDIDLPIDDYDTLNGYLISLIDRIPQENEQISIEAEGFLFEVQSVENKMIKMVKVSKVADAIEEKRIRKED